VELTELKNRICESFSGDRNELQKILDLVDKDGISVLLTVIFGQFCFSF
jgi:hypothetical protein